MPPGPPIPGLAGRVPMVLCPTPTHHRRKMEWEVRCSSDDFQHSSSATATTPEMQNYATRSIHHNYIFVFFFNHWQYIYHYRNPFSYRSAGSILQGNEVCHRLSDGDFGFFFLQFAVCTRLHCRRTSVRTRNRQRRFRNLLHLHATLLSITSFW